MTEPTLCVTTPLHDGRVHAHFMAGALQSMGAFAGRIRFEVQSGSFLPRNRDLLTAVFLDSGASHMLCIDSDIGWTPADAQKLLDSGKDFVSGCYAKKQPDREIPAKLTGARDGDLLEAEHVPGGFLLVSRAAVERMVGAYRDIDYRTQHGRAWALWSSLFDGGSYDGEDVAFCRRWRKIGGQIWLHRGVILKHFGEQCYVPDQLP